MSTAPPSTGRRVSIVSLGCARNEVDSSEIAGRLDAGGWSLVAEGAEADVMVVNTCAFVASAKKDSIDTLLAAADTGAKVVAVGCLAERYGQELAAALPEADAVLGFDSYPDLANLLGDVLDGHAPPSHVPSDRRTRLPLTPVSRPAAAAAVSLPGHAPASGPTLVRTLLRSGPIAPVKIASGCDRRCTFCAIPSFRGAFVSRPAGEVVDEAHWLAGQGVREIVLVSENSTSYGKDLAGERPLEELLTALDAVPGIDRVRLSYLQPAETRPWLIEAIAQLPSVADYYDMSFQHASAATLRRMRRFGSPDSFLGLVEQIRAAAPEAGIRSNVIVGFPGETEEELADLERFLIAARLDTVGVFGYSDEDGTAAMDLPDHLPEEVVAERVERITSLVEELTAQRAEDRIGTVVEVLVDEQDPLDAAPGELIGRAAHQAPEVDGSTTLLLPAGLSPEDESLRPGRIVRARVVASDGVDLRAVPLAHGPDGVRLP
ncbi:30S ribosomal protein S12 methylthiotransferase RimO [Nakamurella flavida]|uniref:Ribosomal protein uS12 methylthiotransferase RimO n=1 Tax=Nakamurella flavida TaxID=363630 RepID=A0A939BZ20_9ACTN|nr:30S ribosomal protein S12 methylthiotransferase RimO [Nakamurella flavida]MBM9475273.1 30S ribosomal protein S12 methylthiotransferase RimO [Nakamurella flavida]MDP9776847.1 ribosomal protein S12 methylthiotransferase RimO [Nakamurella flavida]